MFYKNIKKSNICIFGFCFNLILVKKRFEIKKNLTKKNALNLKKINFFLIF